MRLVITIQMIRNKTGDINWKNKDKKDRKELNEFCQKMNHT